MIVCPGCHAPIENHALFCENCGLPLQQADTPKENSLGMNSVSSARAIPPGMCSTCGYTNLAGEMFCQNCGVQLPPVISAPPSLPQALSAAKESHSQAGGGKCSYCEQENGSGDVYCQNCGQELISLNETLISIPSFSPTPVVASMPIPRMAIAKKACFVVQSSQVNLPIPAEKTDILIGRQDMGRNVFPEIDLTGQDAESGSVSRRHARMIFKNGQWFIEDLHSTNYTFVNREMLPPGQLRPLQNGDEVRVGKVLMIYHAS